MKVEKNTVKLIFALIFMLIFKPATAQTDVLTLSGKWKVYLDSAYNDLTNKSDYLNFTSDINLPGTTDDAGIGIANTLVPKLERPQVLRLRRKNSFIGVATYTREFNIDKKWLDKKVILKLERVLWQSKVKVNGKELPSVQESLVTPHYHDISSLIVKGRNTIQITVDNRKKYDVSVGNMAHAYTNETQIIWNGVLGEISCTAYEKVRITALQLFPDIKNNCVKVVMNIHNDGQKTQKLKVKLGVHSSKSKLPVVELPVVSPKGAVQVVAVYKMGTNYTKWSEFSPELYTMTADLKLRNKTASVSETFGMREIGKQNNTLLINNQPLFLRGTLECAIFPLTGYPPMNKEGWLKVFENARKWGLNHLRFHSWCPPEAAFQVADEMGFYLQVELPLWSLTVNKDQATNDFLFAEADNIIREYGNHPSFCFWSIGNELQPDFKFLNAFVDRLKSLDSRHLYTNTSYTFEKGHGAWPELNDDFFITQTTKQGWVRGQGVFDSEPPTFNKDYSKSVAGLTVPLITHEIGQYAVYPDMKEIEKYTGVLDPLNFKAVKADLTKKNLIHRANDYLMASGKLAAILYKEEIERAMKTTGISGFQLLDLHDFPGQGTALVGLLNAFWDSKGLIAPEEFRFFCAPVVPLIEFEKATYTSEETFEAGLSIANYGNTELKGNNLKWQISQDGKVLRSGTVTIGEVIQGFNPGIGKISAKLNDIKNASTLTVSVEIEQTDFKNSWQIWVYPADLKIEEADILVTNNLQEAMTALEAGKNVLFSPKTKSINGLEGKFVQVFWSPVHFPNQPGTMGLLINPEHQALKYFPTEMHTNWQWWDLCKQSKTINLDSIPGATPIVENVDNFMKNRRLCSIFEAKVGKGKVIFSSMDLITDIEQRPAAKQMLFSLTEYMKSVEFKPLESVEASDVELLIISK